jgi:hypothetical protein
MDKYYDILYEIAKTSFGSETLEELNIPRFIGRHHLSRPR